MSQFAAPKPPLPRNPHATLELLPELDAVPDDDDLARRPRGAGEAAAFDADATPPPLVSTSPFATPSPPSSMDTLPELSTARHARARSVVVGVVAASIGLLAMALAFRPWQWTHTGTGSVSAARAPVAVTLAKRSAPPMPRAKSFATAKNTKPASAAARQPATHAKPATPTKPAATRAKPGAASKAAAPHKPAATRKPASAPAKAAPKRPTTKP